MNKNERTTLTRGFTPLEIKSYLIRKKSSNGARFLTGFTLMELLVAMGILSVISISCYVAFDTALKSWRKSEARIERYQNARAILDMIAKDLQSAFIVAGNNTYRLIETTVSGAEAIYFTTSAIEVATNVYEIGYARRTSDNVLLKQTDTPPDGDTSTSDITSEVAQGITGLGFDYGYYNNSTRTQSTWRWASTWDSYNTIDVTNYDKSGNSKTPYDGLPEAIRIGLAVRDEKSYEAAQSFYTIVYLPNAE